MSKSNAKSELRAACKAAGIEGYSKLTVGGMRDALARVTAGELPISTESTEGETVTLVEPEVFVLPEGMDIHDCNCPSCGIQLDNGVLTPDDEVANQAGVTYHMTGQLLKEYECMGCGHQFGADVAPLVAGPDRHTGTGLKIEKDRPERNGIKRPSIGGKCRAIWDYLDTVEAPTAKVVRAAAEANGWNPNNAVIEFYQWRKFNAA